MRRFAVVAVLALASLAQPIGALCSTCCPGSDSAQKLGAAMPCCAEDCAPRLGSTKTSAPAVVVGSGSRDRLDFALTTLTFELPASIGSRPLDSLLSPSPPPDAERPSSVLRL